MTERTCDRCGRAGPDTRVGFCGSSAWMAVYLNERGIDPGPHVRVAAHPEELPKPPPGKRVEAISVVVLSLCSDCTAELELRPSGFHFEPGTEETCVEILREQGLVDPE